MTEKGMSLLAVLEPHGNQWLHDFLRSSTPVPKGVRFVRYEDGENAIFESGALFRMPKKEYDLSS